MPIEEQNSRDRAAADFEAAANRVRDTAKWLIVSFAAVGGVLVAGSQLSSLGSLRAQDPRFWVALTGAVVALTGVVVAIAKVIDVLVMDPLSLKTLTLDPRYADTRRALEKDPFLVPSGNMEAFLERFLEAQRRQRNASELHYEAVRKYLDHRTAPPLADHAEFKQLSDKVRLETDNEMIESRVAQDILAIAALLHISQAFDHAKRWIVGATAVAAIGIVAFAAAANPGTTQGPKAVAKGTKTEVSLTEYGRRTLQPVLGFACSRRMLAAIVLDVSAAGVEVVTIPESSCASVRFVLSPRLGVLS